MNLSLYLYNGIRNGFLLRSTLGFVVDSKDFRNGSEI